MATNLTALPAAKIRFIEPMYAKPVQNLPQGKDWLYEVTSDWYYTDRAEGSGAACGPRRRRRTRQSDEVAGNFFARRRCFRRAKELHR